MLSQKLYAVIGIFEIIFRNSIDRHFVKSKGQNWLADAAQPGGFLDAEGCEHSLHSIQQAINKLGSKYTYDRLIAQLSFGFWVYQVSKKEFAASGSSLLEIFPDRPFGTRQKDIFQRLIKINEIRNRIAHYEPICFDPTSGAISTALAIDRYYTILQLLSWLGCSSKKILYGLDGVVSAIDALEAFVSQHGVPRLKPGSFIYR
ncbi:MAG: hypothetical protein WCF67_12875 [Chitinophagaceae bacterium]